MKSEAAAAVRVGILTAVLLFQAQIGTALAGEPGDCAELLGVQRLSQDAQASLQKAADAYDVRVLSRRIDGRERVVVLLGETHVKNAEASSIGKEVLSHFPLRGIEAAKINEMWGGKFLGVILNMMKPFHRVFTLGKPPEGSTIDDAYADLYVDSLKGIARESGLEKMSLQEQKQFKVSFKASDYHFELDGVELLGMLAQRKKLGLKELKKVENVDIEAGHKPDLAENLASLHIPTTLTVCMVTACASIFGEAVPEAIQQGLGAATLGLGIHLVGGNLIARQFENRKWSWILNPMQGIEGARNLTMAKKIDQALRERPDSESILVIVGRDHVPDLQELLKKSYGYSSK